MKVVRLDKAPPRVVRFSPSELRVINPGGGNADPQPTNPAFEFTQTSPMATWIITHNLGRRPYVDVYIADELVEADVTSTPTVTTITFPAPFAGVAVLF